MKKFVRLAAFVLIGFWMACQTYAAAQETKRAAAELSESQKQILKNIETYFNSLKTMKSRFVQRSGKGAEVEGTIYIQKPGKMRLIYDPPYEVDIYATGYYLIFHDRKLGQVTHLDIDATPATIILKENFSFDSSGLTVTDVRTLPGAVEISLFKTKEPAAGSITMRFSEKPVVLKQWTVADAQRVNTAVSLVNPEFGVKIDPSLLQFVDPRKNIRPGDPTRKRR